MPNTLPVNDSATVTSYIVQRAREVACINVRPIGAITKGSLGDELAAIGSMREAGIVQCREQLGECLAQERVHSGLGIEGVFDGGAEMIGRPPAAEGDPPVGRALPVDDHVSVIGKGGALVEARIRPERVTQRFGGHHE